MQLALIALMALSAAAAEPRALDAPSTRPASASAGSSLLDAIERRDCQRAIRLIAGGADVNASGGRPLILAVAKREWRICLLLIKSGAKVNAKDELGNTPLYYAANSFDKRALNIGRTLVSHGADVKAKCLGGFTPLHCASEQGMTEFMKYLISKGADVNVGDKDGETPLHVACGTQIPEERLESVRVLLAHGAKLNAVDRSGETPLDLARNISKDRDLVAFLEKRGAKSGAVNSRRKNADDRK